MWKRKKTANNGKIVVIEWIKDVLWKNVWCWDFHSFNMSIEAIESNRFSSQFINTEFVCCSPCLLFAIRMWFFFGGGWICVDASFWQKKWKVLEIYLLTLCMKHPTNRKRALTILSLPDACKKIWYFGRAHSCRSVFFGKEFIFSRFFLFLGNLLEFAWVFFQKLSPIFWFFPSNSDHFLEFQTKLYFCKMPRSICPNLHRNFHFFEKSHSFSRNLPKLSVIFSFSQTAVSKWHIFTQSGLQLNHSFWFVLPNTNKRTHWFLNCNQHQNFAAMNALMRWQCALCDSNNNTHILKGRKKRTKIRFNLLKWKNHNNF